MKSFLVLDRSIVIQILNLATKIRKVPQDFPVNKQQVAVVGRAWMSHEWGAAMRQAKTWPHRKISDHNVAGKIKNVVDLLVIEC